MSEPSINYIPNKECVRNAIWSAIKTKTNFVSSKYLYDTTIPKEEVNIDTYGPWTEGIWFKENISVGDSTYDATKDPTARTQYSLNGLFTEKIPTPETSDQGITDEWIDERFNTKSNITISNKFISGQDAEDSTPIEVIESKVIEAKTLLNYLKYLQNRKSSDIRVDRIIKDVYAVKNNEIPNPIPEDSILNFGEDLKKIVYEGSTKGTPINPAVNSLLYIVKGATPNVTPYGGLVGDNLTIKTDLYGKTGTSLNPADNSIKKISIETVQQNGVLMEKTDYIYLGNESEPKLNDEISSQVFNSADLILTYVIKEKPTSTDHGKFYGKLNGDYHDMMNPSEYDEPYPYIKTLKIQCVDDQKNIITLIYDVDTQ